MTSAATTEGYDQVVRPSLRGEQFVVYDDVLSDQHFDRLFRFVAAQDFGFVHQAGWRKVWRLYDGDPLRGPTHWYRPAAEDSAAWAYPASRPDGALAIWFSQSDTTCTPLPFNG